jgi:hypothetical protein
MSTKFFTTQMGDNINHWQKEVKITKYVDEVQKVFLNKYKINSIKKDKSILTYENVIRYSNGYPMNE